MTKGLIGKKIGMTQIFNNEGIVTPVTVIEAGPCCVLNLISSPRTKLQLGFEPVKESKVAKPQLGHFKKIGVQPYRIVKEFESADNKDYKIGQEIKADIFKPGDFVDVTGTTIGKGFQGGMKRWNWKGGGRSHGSMHHRRVGSIGASTTPGRTWKGQTMPGQMGAVTHTVQSLRVLQVDLENNILVLKGAVPGHVNSNLIVKFSKKRAFKSLDEVKVVVESKKNPMKASKAKAGATKGGGGKGK